MVRFVHLADLHLGKEWHGVDRTPDILKAFDQVVDYIYQKEAPLLLIAGDIFDKKLPSGNALEAFFPRIKKLLQKGVYVVMVTGNHDWNKLHEAFSTLALFTPNLRIFAKTDISNPVLLLEEIGCQIIPFPYPERGRLEGEVFLKEGDTPGMYVKISARFSSYLQGLRDKINPRIPSIFLAHVGLEGARLGSEKMLSLEDEPVIGEKDLPSWTTYNALGHLHRAQEVRSQTPSFYSGSLERLDFGESEEEKGFYYVEASNAGTKCEFIKIDAHIMYDITVNFDELHRLKDRYPDISNAYLKLRVKMSQNDSLIEIRSKISEFYPNALVIETIKDWESSSQSKILPTYSDPVTAFEDYTSEQLLEDKFKADLMYALKGIIHEIEEEE